nr:MAG TPA: hypothetical protein [Caudoviricetes sp.]
MILPSLQILTIYALSLNNERKFIFTVQQIEHMFDNEFKRE